LILEIKEVKNLFEEKLGGDGEIKAQPHYREDADDRITSLDVMLNTVVESHNAEVRAYEDLEDKLEDVIEMLRNRVPHSDILDHLRVKDSRKSDTPHKAGGLMSRAASKAVVPLT
jgi:hypothetical protein